MAEKYGITPEQVGVMPDEVLFDMIPNLAESDAEEKARAKRRN